MYESPKLNYHKEMKIKKRIKRREEKKKKALYVRLPHTIKDEQDVANLFTGNFKVRLLRQSSRYCYVIFPNRKERIRNLKTVNNTKINGKRVIVAPAILKKPKETNVSRKKIVIPEIEPDMRITKHLFVSNIKYGTKVAELRAAIPDCVSIKMLKPYSLTSRAAIIKMQSAQLAAEYLTKMREQPIVAGRKLRINPDTRNRHRRQNSKPLKIYNGEPNTRQQISKKGSVVLDHIVLENKA